MMIEELAVRSNPRNEEALLLFSQYGEKADQHLVDFTVRCPDASEALMQAVMYVELAYPPGMLRKPLMEISDEELIRHWGEVWQDGLPHGLDFAMTMLHNTSMTKEVRRRADSTSDVDSKVL
jgi:hypothetical protein